MADKYPPAKLGLLLANVERAHPAGQLRRLWREVVGDRVAARSEAGWLKGDVLTVRVASPVWAQELTMLSEPILAGLAARGIHARQLRFRVTDLGRPAAPSPALAKPAPPPPQRAQLSADLTRRLAQIDDLELRQRIRDAAELTLARAAKR